MSCILRDICLFKQNHFIQLAPLSHIISAYIINEENVCVSLNLHYQVLDVDTYANMRICTFFDKFLDTNNWHFNITRGNI